MKRNSGEIVNVVRPGLLRFSAEAGSAASHPRPRSSSPNQSVGFDLVRSGSGMSLLSRNTRKQGIWSLSRRRPSGAKAPRDKSEYFKREPASRLSFEILALHRAGLWPRLVGARARVTLRLREFFRRTCRRKNDLILFAASRELCEADSSVIDGSDFLCYSIL